MNVELGTVFRWTNFPLARYGDKDKPRWFVCVGFSGYLSHVASLYLCTTTTQIDNFNSSGSRKGHSHFIFKVSEFPCFEQDCAIDFDEKPYVIPEGYLSSYEKDLEVRGKLDVDILKMIYKRLLSSDRLSFVELCEIHDSYNRAGITGLKKPKRYR